MRRTSIIVGAAVAAVAIATAGWAAVAPLPAGTRELVYTVPKGSAARLSASGASAFPSRLRFTVGVRDVLVLRNDDDVPASFGPVRLESGQTYRVPFDTPAQFDLACSLHPAGQVSIVVVPKPEPGWARVTWRLAEIFNQ
jgi:hypothetical protein